MTNERKILAIWLLPAAPARDFFRTSIENMASRFDAPVFEPHLTLLGTDLDETVPFDALNKLARPKSIELEIESIDFSEKYTKTLFVQFRQRAELLGLRDSVARALGNEKGDELNPHLSLIYKKLPNETKMQLAREMELPFDRVRFDGMKAIVTPAVIESRLGVESWQTVWEMK